MKKLIRTTMLGLAAIMGISIAACSPEKAGPGGAIDKNKTQIYVDAYNGGNGVSWLEDMATAWNATQTAYEVIVNGKEKFTIETVMANVESGLSATSATMYYTVTAKYTQAFIDGDYLVDLSDLLTRDVDGNGTTIGDKWGISEAFRREWKRVASKSDGTGLYYLPHDDGYLGLVYDHDTFLKYGWLNYARTSEASAAAGAGIQTSVEGDYLVVTSSTSDYYKVGDKLLTKGQDGKYGTYDDGQPVTYAEWKQMIEKIVDIDQKKAFLWTGKNAEYMDPIFYATLKKLGGEDTWNAVMNRHSQGEKIFLNDGSSVAIDYNNGYLADKAQALTDTLNFMEEIVCDEEAVNAKSYSTIVTYTDAQNAFLLGYLNESSNPETAFLAEGTWWENEARPFFISLGKDDAERGFGQRRYRYMLLPDFEGQKSEMSYFSAVSFGSVAIMKLSDTEANNKKTEATKDFLAFTLKEENLRKFNVATGTVKPYRYTLTAEDRTKMTPFARCVYDIYKDVENVEVIHAELNSNPFWVSSNYYGVEWLNTTRSLPYANMASCIKAGGGAASMISRWNTRCSENKWAQYVQEAKALGLIQE